MICIDNVCESIGLEMHPEKLYSIYAPTNHPKETIHRTKADAEH